MTTTARLFDGKLFEGGLFNGGIFEGGANALASLIALLFGASEQGILYLPGLDTCYTDNGTTLCTAPGDLVYRINDSSGNGNHATQATAASRPILRQDGGGRYYLEFDGVDDFLATAAINFTSTDAMSAFCGVSCTLASGTRGELFFIDGGYPRRFALEFNSSTIQIASSSGGSVGPTAAIKYSPTYPLVVTALAKISTDMNILRWDGVEQASNTADQGTGTMPNAVLYIGSANGVVFPYKDRIYALIVRGALSSATELAAAESYIAGKTGVTL